MKPFLSSAALLLVVSGCAVPNVISFSTPNAQVADPSPGLAWARNDGRLISGDTELTNEAQSDISDCGAALPPVRTRGRVVGEPCMNERGYYVREQS